MFPLEFIIVRVFRITIVMALRLLEILEIKHSDNLYIDTKINYRHYLR